jgi:cation diffusion facilitator CzcD-associated flavoprotein CzcO
VLHTSLYKNGTAYRGQRVLVVGFGNSAAEIAIDLHEHGALPTLSVRGPVNVLPRDVFGIPVVNLGLIQRVFPPRIADIISAPLMRLILGDLSKLGLQRPAVGPAAQIAEQHQIPVLDIGTIGLIRAGKIALRPGIERFTASGVVFADGRQEEFAAVILGTGYRAQLQELLAGVAGVLDSEGTPLTSGSRTAAAGLYFCGFTVAAGGQLREIGIEAGRIAGLIKAAPQR